MQKLILTQEVSGLGSAGDLVEVKDGYARNYLVPRGLAIAATKGAEKQVATIRRAREQRGIRDLGSAKETAATLSALDVTLPARAGDGGRLFGSITPADVVAAVKAAGGPALDRRRLTIGTPIKSVGRHEVSVVLHPEVSATVAVQVVPA